MDAERERRLEDLFHRALEQDAEERAEFLARECAEDPELLRRAEALLARDAEGTSTLLRDGLHGQDEAPHDSIGRYTLVKRLGEGGMGTVWLATQEEPVRREVALKTIRIGSDSEEVAARFEVERQALAVMNHPGIAKVFDAGWTEAGLPYFVMEYVPGRPLDRYVAEAKLDLPGVLALFGRVCDAVQHAHQKGILHRDLKPGNILVLERDGVPYPKVIDFGIARALGAEVLRSVSPNTGGRPVGTAPYMSPEQADPAGDLDTRTDIYALGVLLYELLVGERPFDLAGLGPAEIWKVLLEQDPPRPSERFAGLPAGRAREVAAGRGLEPRELRRRLRGDLDWITLKALEKERSRRYASASELRADLRRHLEHMPISAGPPGSAYRLGKFLRRHRLGVLGAGTVVVGLAVALVLSLASLGVASRARAGAEEDLARAKYEEAKSRAFMEWFQYALTLGHPLVNGGRDLTVEELFELSSESVQDLFHDRPEAEAAVRFTLGNSYLLLGEDDLALRELRTAYRLQEATLDTEPEHLDLMRTLTGLVQASRRTGRDAEAERYVQESLEKSQRILTSWRPEMGEDLELLFQAAHGASNDPERELQALENLLSDFPRDDSAESLALSRLVVQAALVGSAGPAALERLEAVAADLLGERHPRFLLFEWFLAELWVESSHPEPASGLGVARRLGERAGEVLGREHWLSIDARRLEGLAQAGLWKESRSIEDLARAEEAILEATRRVATLDRAPSFRLREAAAGPATLSASLGTDEDRRAWLEASWRRWLGGEQRRPWWPATYPGLTEAFRTAAIELLGGSEEPPARELGAYALARQGSFRESLQALDALRQENGGKEAPLARAFRALDLAGLGRGEEAGNLLEELGREESASHELGSLLEELAERSGG